MRAYSSLSKRLVGRQVVKFPGDRFAKFSRYIYGMQYANCENIAIQHSHEIDLLYMCWQQATSASSPQSAEI